MMNLHPADSTGSLSLPQKPELNPPGELTLIAIGASPSKNHSQTIDGAGKPRAAHRELSDAIKGVIQ